MQESTKTMEKPIIEVKHIGKRYNIVHQRGRYITLRDVIANVFKNPFRFLISKAKQATGIQKKEEFWALKDVNFTVERGEVIGIIGSNGAGKSTLLKILSQITPPTEGEIVLRGRVGSLLEVGTGFHPELTGRENIFLNGAILGMKKKEIAKKFDQIVEFAGIEKFLDTPVKHYSSGMYVRLAFSVAAHMEPDILIVDEVLAVGDAEFQKKCLGKMEEISQKEGRTVLFVSHNLVTIQGLCQKTILLEKGSIKKVGPTQEIIASYLHERSNPTYVEASTVQLKNAGNVGDIRFTSVKVSTIDGSASIQSNSRLRFTLGYESNFKDPIADTRIVITVTNSKSERVALRLDSDVALNTIPYTLSPKGQIVCETGKIDLIEGVYSVEIDFLTQGTSRDHIKAAAEFNVLSNLDHYGYKIDPDKAITENIVPYTFN